MLFGSNTLHPTYLSFYWEQNSLLLRTGLIFFATPSPEKPISVQAMDKRKKNQQTEQTVKSIPGVYTEEREGRLLLWICLVAEQCVSVKGLWETWHCQQREVIALGAGSSLNAPKSSPK